MRRGMKAGAEGEKEKEEEPKGGAQGAEDWATPPLPRFSEFT